MKMFYLSLYWVYFEIGWYSYGGFGDRFGYGWTSLPGLFRKGVYLHVTRKVSFYFYWERIKL